MIVTRTCWGWWAHGLWPMAFGVGDVVDVVVVVVVVVVGCGAGGVVVVVLVVACCPCATEVSLATGD